jgi:nucleotide-binding universal stress UspA family protein
MKGYRKILIAVNGSLEVLNKGLQVASDEKTWVTVVKVLPPYEGDLNLTGVKDIGDLLSSGAGETATALSDAVRREGSLARVRVEEGDISEVIKEVAREERCDLIVMGKRRNRGLFRRVFGDNVAGKVVEDSPCPVLFVNA